MNRIHVLVAALALAVTATAAGCLAVSTSEEAEAAAAYNVTCYASGGIAPGFPMVASSLQIRDNTNAWVITQSGTGVVYTTTFNCISN